MKHLKSKLIASKKTILLVLFSVSALSYTYGQTGSGFGVKGGLNYNANGDYFDAIENSYQHPDGNVGYHIGIFGKIGDKIYFKPELVYTNTKSDYDDDTFTMQKLDAPLLVGINLIGPLSVFAGPSLQYVLDSEFGNITVNDIKEDFSVGLNFGVAVNFNNIGIDLRYERGLSDNEAKFLNDTVTPDRIDTRSDQLILGLSVKL